jgi:hypothetical protein
LAHITQKKIFKYRREKHIPKACDAPGTSQQPCNWAIIIISLHGKKVEAQRTRNVLKVMATSETGGSPLVCSNPEN